MTRIICAVVLACCFSAPLPAKADPITISGGALTTVGLSGATEASLTGDGFAVAGGGMPGISGPAASCFPCIAGAGEPVNFDSIFLAELALASGPATVNGVSYTEVWYAGVLAMDGETLAFPNGSSSLELASPFSLISGGVNGSFLEGYLTPDREGSALFRVDLVGSGRATASYVEGPERGQFFYERTTFSFLAPAPIPEPASLLLLATGLIGLGVRRWRQRKA